MAKRPMEDVLAKLEAHQEQRQRERRLADAAPRLLAGLKSLLNRYVELAGSGDCGFWDVEKDPDVIDARAAIKLAEGS